MRELNEQEQTEVTGGLLGFYPNPGIGPAVSSILVDVVLNFEVQKQLGQVNVRDQINPAEMSS